MIAATATRMPEASAAKTITPEMVLRTTATKPAKTPKMSAAKAATASPKAPAPESAKAPAAAPPRPRIRCGQQGKTTKGNR
jgi:hypothetical protein